MNEPFIVMCAPNGARRSRDDHARLPVTPDELADCAGAILDAGASIMHVHVRDDEGGHSLDAGRYRAVIAAIRARVGDDLVIQVTTEACGVYSPAEQMKLVRELEPDAASVALRELCPERGEAEAATFYRWMADNDVMAQHILYSVDDARRFEALRSSGIVPDENPFVLFVLGSYTQNLAGDVSELGGLIDAVADDTTWAVCCFGATEHAAAIEAAGRGGHTRVGFENNLLLPDGRLAAGNEDLVGHAAAAGKACGRRPATAEDVRRMFS